jgi:hypothetical protein
MPAALSRQPQIASVSKLFRNAPFLPFVFLLFFAVGLIFLLIAVTHVLRLALKWEVVLNSWLVPMWVSANAVVITAYLALESLKLGRRS